jgi:hypothetical protein
MHDPQAKNLHGLFRRNLKKKQRRSEEEAKKQEREKLVDNVAVNSSPQHIFEAAACRSLLGSLFKYLPCPICFTNSCFRAKQWRSSTTRFRDKTRVATSRLAFSSCRIHSGKFVTLQTCCPEICFSFLPTRMLVVRSRAAAVNRKKFALSSRERGAQNFVFTSIKYRRDQFLRCLL